MEANVCPCLSEFGDFLVPLGWEGLVVLTSPDCSNYTSLTPLILWGPSPSPGPGINEVYDMCYCVDTASGHLGEPVPEVWFKQISTQMKRTKIPVSICCVGSVFNN